MKTLITTSLLAVALCSTSIAQDEYARVAFVTPGASKAPMPKDQYVTMVIDGSEITYEGTKIPKSEVVSLINAVLESKKISYIGVYVREGTKYGDVVQGLDLLRETKAKSIGVSTSELPYGKEL